MEAFPTYAAYITPENRNLAFIAAIQNGVMQATLDVGTVHPLAFPPKDKAHLKHPYAGTKENFAINDALTRIFIFGKMPLQDIGPNECVGITFPLPMTAGEGSLFKH